MMIFFGVGATLFTYPIFATLEHTHSVVTAFALVMASLIIVTGYTSINAIIKAEMFPADIRALGRRAAVRDRQRDLRRHRRICRALPQEHRPRALVLHLYLGPRGAVADRLRPDARDQDHQPDRGRLMDGGRRRRAPVRSVAADRRPADPDGARQLADDLQRRRRQLAHRDRPVDPRPPRDPAHRSLLLHLGGQAVGADRMARRSALRGRLPARRLQRHRGAGDRGADGAPRDRLLQRRAVRSAVDRCRPIVAMDFVLIPMMLARPHLLAWPLIAFWTWLMLRARERDRAPPLAAALADGAVGEPPRQLRVRPRDRRRVRARGADRLVRTGRARSANGCCSASPALAAVFINANGVEGVLHPLRFASLAMLPLIDEWKPSSPTVDAGVLRRPRRRRSR